MFIDSRSEFSDKQVVTGANTASTNTVDAQSRDIGPGEPLFLLVQLDADVAGAVTVNLRTADTETFTGAQTIGAVTIPAGAKKGERFILGFPYRNKRYIALQYSEKGTFSAWLSGDPPAAWKPYPAVV